MSIAWNCACGKHLKAPDGSEGKRARCPACGQINLVPTPEPEPEPMVADGDSPFDEYDLAETPAPLARQTVAAPLASDEAVTPPVYQSRAARQEEADDDDDLPLSENRGRTWRDFTYLVLLLAMLPLVVTSFSKDKATIIDRLEQSVQHHPEVEDKLATALNSKKGGLDDLINIFPGHKLDGAFLERGTMVHWLFALLSAGTFLTLMLFLFHKGSARAKNLLLTGLFTGTAGIILLLGFQYVAEWTQGFWVRGRSILVLLFYIVKFIGYSYTAADDPTNGFLGSFFGYTFGVGLCEELCKALPLILLIRNLPQGASWRTACLWGLASGVGFGVAEGIMYSGRYYNGIEGGEAYVVRFVSCVALHAVWAAAVAICLYKFRSNVAGAEHPAAVLFTIVVIALPSIILHGLYDTLLKKDYQAYALVVALISFVYLVFLIEWSQLKRDDGDQPRRGGRLAMA
jgi:RsiW-degrading membrane proteinase PrsW (M82 family)